MLQNKIEKQSHNIVLVGNFIPSILQPEWFEKYNLLGPQEAKKAESSINANIEIINRDLSIFEIDWLRLQVLRDRFFAKSDQPAYFEFLFDLVVNTFAILEHTPLIKLGINIDCQYQFHDKNAYKNFIKAVYNKKVVEKIGPCEFDGIAFKSSIKKEPLNGFTRIRIEKSNVYPEDGIFIEINDHYEGNKNNKDSYQIIEYLKSNWKNSIQESYRLIENITAL